MYEVSFPGEIVPRAVGRRIGYRQVPRAVREWVATEFLATRVVEEHIGGMSPGCATTLATADDQRVFVKAVGVELNAQTPQLFRREAALLDKLADQPYRPVFLGSYDHGGWVALAFEAVAGRYPCFSAGDDFDAVAQTVHAQIAELTPPPPGIVVEPLAATARRWATRWADQAEDPARTLPGWVADRFDELFAAVRTLPQRLPSSTLCHFDVRDDNLLVRPDGRVAILDWGMARTGPAWTDLVLLAAQLPTAHQSQQQLLRWIPEQAATAVTDLLVAFAGSQAWNAAQPAARAALPTFAQFARSDSRRLFAIARLRLATSFHGDGQPGSDE